MNKIPKIYALGTRFNTGILSGPVAVEEKIDGSQFSFCYKGGALMCRSKGRVISGDPGMFKDAYETATRLASEGKLIPGAVYQCEYLAKPKHNVLTYARIPAGHLVLFDICFADCPYERGLWGPYAPPSLKESVAQTLGLEPVPLLHYGPLSPTQEWLGNFLQTNSVLGGCKVEGIVIKNYGLNHPKSESGTAPMTAKIVSDRFKEKQAHQPRSPKAGQDEHIEAIILSLRTEARWLKAIQHLNESGTLVKSEKDIGPLVREIQRDTLAEEEDWIKQMLFDAFASAIHRGVVQGFAEYYKTILREGASAPSNQQQ